MESMAESMAAFYPYEVPNNKKDIITKNTFTRIELL
jgi:hypothetical protein